MKIAVHFLFLRRYKSESIKKALHYIRKKMVPMGKKLAASMVLVVLVLSLVGAVASARWDAGDNCIARLSISGTTATCGLTVYGESNNDRITATVQIIRINSDGSRTAVKAWNGLTGTGSLTFSETHTSSLLAPSATYRMYYSVDVAGVDSIEDYVEYKK